MNKSENVEYVNNFIVQTQNESEKSVENTIYVQDLHYRYENQSGEAIKGISFEIYPGEIFGFVGPSGAGKTTILKILVGLLKKYKGKTIVLGKEINKWDTTLYYKIGVSPEQPNHFSKLTALENLKYFATLYDLNSINYSELFKMVNLVEDMNKLVSEYSKGMKMRLNFIRALLHDPEILFLDEPTTGLDPIHAKMIKDLILDLRNKGKTIFLTTHNMDLAEELCDRVCIINKGELKAIVDPRNFSNRLSLKKVSVQYVSDQDQINEKEFLFDDLGSNNEFFTTLKGEKVIRISTIEPSLEELFIQLARKED